MKVWLVQNGDYWKAVWEDSNGRQSKSLGSRKKITEARANRLCRDIERGMVRKASTIVDIPAMCEEYVSDRARAVKNFRAVGYAQQTLDKHTCKIFSEHFGNRPVSVLRAEDVEEWVEVLVRDRGLAPYTVRNHFARMRAVYDWAIRKGYAVDNPFKEVRVGRPRATKVKARLTNENVAQIIAGCGVDRALRNLVAMCALAGLRKNEARLIEWSGVRFTENRLTPEGKTGVREVLLVPELAEILRGSLDMERPCPISADAADKRMRTLQQRLGLVYARPLHSLRDWRATTWGLQYPKNVVNAWMGHSEDVAVEFYRHVPESAYVQGGVQIRGAEPQVLVRP